MAVIQSGVSTNLMGVGEETASPGHVVNKPLPYGTLGHYRVCARFALVNTQAANSRLFELRNPHASRLVVPTRLSVRWLQTAAHTAAIEDSIDFFKVTGFSAVDSANTVTPTPSLRRATMSAVPEALLRHVTVAGAAAGMTGGTLIKDASCGGQLPKWLLAAVPTAGNNIESALEYFDQNDDTHHWVFGQNEGFILENRVLLGAAAGSAVYVDLSWAEMTAY